jgi:hypothetical protein
MEKQPPFWLVCPACEQTWDAGPHWEGCPTCRDPAGFPQAVYAPVAVTQQQPAVQPVQVAIVTLRPDAAPADLRAKELSVVLSNR